jgi:hypothetical protein
LRGISRRIKRKRDGAARTSDQSLGTAQGGTPLELIVTKLHNNFHPHGRLTKSLGV